MNLGKKKTIEFINQIELLAENFDAGKILYSTLETCDEKIFLQNLVINARELIEHNEWFIALENTIDNLYEVNYLLDSSIVDLAINAFESVSTDLAIIKSLEEIRKT